jgi:regulatory protein
MRIERLENSKHKQERVLVYLEDGTLLRITGAELLQFGLYQGLDLPPETLEELRAAAAPTPDAAAPAWPPAACCPKRN